MSNVKVISNDTHYSSIFQVNKLLKHTEIFAKSCQLMTWKFLVKNVSYLASIFLLSKLVGLSSEIYYLNAKTT